MAWTEPRTWVTSELVTASQLNTHVRDNFNEVFRAIDRSNTVVDVVNTTSLVSLHAGAVHTSLTGWTIPAGVMGASRGIRVTVTGDALYNDADFQSAALYLYVANTLVASDPDMFSPLATNPNREGIRFGAEVWNLAANSQIGTLFYSNSYRGINYSATGATLGTADTTASWKLDIAVQWTHASGQNSFRRRHCVLELI